MAKNNEEKPFLSDEQIAILKKDLVDFKESDQEAFITVVQSTRLDPFTKQVYMLPSRKQRDSNNKWLDKMIHAGIQGLRTVADRSGVFDGSDPIEWCGQDGNWVQIWLSDQDPYAAKATVWRKDHTRPEVAIAYWKARVQTHWDSTARKHVRNDVWADDGPNMIAKCAEAAALRKLFPSQLTGIYEEGERPTHDDIATPMPPTAPSTLETDIAAQQARINESAAAAERLRAQGVTILPPTAPEPPRDAKKEVEPPDDINFEPPPSVTDDDSWKNISCDLIKPFAGRVVADLDLNMLLQAVEKWVPKVRAKWNDTTQPYRDLAEALEKGLEEAQKQEQIRQANTANAAAEGAQ